MTTSSFRPSPADAAAECGRRRAARASHAARTLARGFLGHEPLLGPGKPLREAIERGAITSMVLWGPPGLRQNHARAPARALHGQGVRDVQRRHRGRAARARDHPRGRAAPPRRRPRHDSLLRRDPSLQPRAAGCVPAVGRSRRDHADRRDDREPVVRAQLRALSRLRVFVLEPLDRSSAIRAIVERAAREARAPRAAAPCRRSTTQRSTCSCGTPTATRAARSTRPRRCSSTSPRERRAPAPDARRRPRDRRGGARAPARAIRQEPASSTTT